MHLDESAIQFLHYLLLVQPRTTGSRHHRDNLYRPLQDSFYIQCGKLFFLPYLACSNTQAFRYNKLVYYNIYDEINHTSECFLEYFVDFFSQIVSS